MGAKKADSHRHYSDGQRFRASHHPFSTAQPMTLRRSFSTLTSGFYALGVCKNGAVNRVVAIPDGCGHLCARVFLKSY
jgi:hypothetical protein